MLLQLGICSETLVLAKIFTSRRWINIVALEMAFDSLGRGARFLGKTSRIEGIYSRRDREREKE